MVVDLVCAVAHVVLADDSRVTVSGVMECLHAVSSFQLLLLSAVCSDGVAVVPSDAAHR